MFKSTFLLLFLCLIVVINCNPRKVLDIEKLKAKVPVKKTPLKVTLPKRPPRLLSSKIERFPTFKKVEALETEENDAKIFEKKLRSPQPYLKKQGLSVSEDEGGRDTKDIVGRPKSNLRRLEETKGFLPKEDLAKRRVQGEFPSKNDQQNLLKNGASKLREEANDQQDIWVKDGPRGP